MFVYLDTETTGLDPNRHQVWEIAYAVDDEPIQSSFVAHDPVTADPQALRMNGYLERAGYALDLFGSLIFETKLREALDGATLVAANPAFDAAFLRARWGVTPWRYRMLDVEAYAMGALGWDEPRGLRDIAAELGIDAPDHTAAKDVAVLRECHRSLRKLYGAAA